MNNFNHLKIEEANMHVSLRHDYARNLIKDGIISLTYVKSSENLADPITKPLTKDLVRSASSRIGLNHNN